MTDRAGLPEILNVPLACPLEERWRGAVAAIGNMDGVHRGHRILLEETVRLAGAKPPVALVFQPHPRRVFAPESPPFLLTDLATKAELMGEIGIERIYVLPFVEALYTQTPEQFVQGTLCEILGLSGIVTGAEFHFGKGRAGDIASLKRLAAEAGMTAHTVSLVLGEENAKVSSSAVRAAIAAGNLREAAHLLGRPWSIRGEVAQGRQLGRTIDFPTANLSIGEYVRPPHGVFAVRARTGSGAFGGVANFGLRPTVGGTTEPLLEVHLFDFNGDLYGQTLRVELIEFIRPEQKFDGLPALKAQIAKDADTARAILRSA